MRVTKIFFVLALVLGSSAGCNEPSLEEEVDDVCACIQSSESEAEFNKCQDKMNEVMDKYAFDPEAADDIKKRLDECASN